VALTCPVTVKDAAVTVPTVAGRVTPPVADLVGVPEAAGRTTVPSEEPTAIFPKLISVTFEIAIGVIIVAVAVAVALTWASAFTENAINTTARPNNFTIRALILSCLILYYDSGLSELLTNYFHVSYARPALL
jgi:hypothetical protein